MKIKNIFNRFFEIKFQKKTDTLERTIQLSLFFIIPFLAVSPLKTYAQPNLGTSVNFVLFTSAGNVGNTGTSVINGNIGTNSPAGTVLGFGSPSTHNGNIEIGTAATSQCATDVQAAYTQISTTAATIAHAAIFGNGETVVAGVYGIPSAGSVSGNLTLDGGGNSNSIFIFKFGGAFTTTALSTIMLTNGAQAANVFWVASGAIAMAASTTMKGTLIASPGAVSMAAGGDLDGRMLSTAGAITTDNINATGSGGAVASDNDNDGVPDTDDNCPNTTTAQASSAGFITDCTASPTSCGCTDADGDAFFPDAVSSAATYDPDDTDACIPNASAANCNSGCNVVAPTLSGN